MTAFMRPQHKSDLDGKAPHSRSRWKGNPVTGTRKIFFFTLIFLLLASTVRVQTEDREFLIAYDKGLLSCH